MNTEHRQQKISFWHSMKTQFIAVVILVAAVIVILYTLMIMPGVKSNIRSIYSNYLLDLSISYGREVESAMQVNADFLDNPEAAQDILQQIDVAGAKTAYAYLVGFDGTMLYHPTAEKIGQPVENDAVKKMLKEIQGGSIPKPETVQYVFQGEKKFSACYTSKKQFILVVTADDAELLAPALMLEQRGILISGVLLLLGALAAFVFATRITRPLSKITDSVNRIAQLDLRNDQVLEQCAAHRGEVGIIANAVLRMKEALTEIVQKIRQQGEQLFDASETLNNNAAKTAGNVNNVETAVGIKLYKILELQVVNIPFVHILSLMATETPARGPVSVPSSIIFCTSFARIIADSSSTVTKLLISFSFARIASRAALVASSTVTSCAFIFFPSSTAVSDNKFIAAPPYSTVFGTTNARSRRSGAFASVSSPPSPFSTTSSRNTFCTGNTWDIGSTLEVSSSFNLSI